MNHDELRILDLIRSREMPCRQVLLGIGDDMAVLTNRSDRLLLSTDMLLDGVHFQSGVHSPKQIGRKALARCLSDCAAMAVRPIAALVSLALPCEMTLVQVEELLDGLFQLASQFDVAIVGGDTARWKHPLGIDVAMMAEPWPSMNPIGRRGARSGDGLFVSGPLGGGMLGRHMSFVPRIQEARSLAERLGSDLHAMIDISDGLSLDLWRLCVASGVGAVLNEAQLQPVISEDARRAAESDGISALQHALSDGEDYELLFAAPAGAADDSVFPIGVVADAELRFQRNDGAIETLTPKGFIH